MGKTVSRAPTLKFALIAPLTITSRLPANLAFHVSPLSGSIAQIAAQNKLAANAHQGFSFAMANAQPALRVAPCATGKHARLVWLATPSKTDSANFATKL